MRDYLVICTENKTNAQGFKVGKTYTVNRNGFTNDDGDSYTSFLRNGFGNNPRDKWINWTSNTSVNFKPVKEAVRRF